MKKMSRLMSALLAAALLLSISCAAVAEDVSVYIPNKLAKLDLPDDVETYEGDPFKTGMDGAVTTIEWDDATIIPECGGYLTLDYIRSVTVVYPAGNYIRKVVAEYTNDKKKSLSKYTITYQTGENEYYTISYAAKTGTVAEDHGLDGINYATQGIHSYINNDTGEVITVNLNAAPASQKLLEDYVGAVYLHHYSADEILEGDYTDGSVRLHSGSGNNAGKWYAYDSVSGVYTQSRKGGLRSIFSFKSPRVQ